MRKVFWWSLGFYAAVLGVQAWTLPAEGVVLHSGLSGPDRYGSKVEFLGVMAGVGVGMALLFCVLGELLIARTDLRSPLVNLPHKEWWTETPERMSQARGMIINDFYGFGAATVVFLALTMGAVQYLPAWVAGVLVVLFLAGIAGWCVVIMSRRYRPRS